jgi:hypothetical protein
MLWTARDCCSEPIRPDVEPHAADRTGDIRQHARLPGASLRRTCSFRVVREPAPRRAVTAMLPSFGDLVSHIERLCAKEQVIRPDALTDITSMQHGKSRRNRSVIQNPRQTMSRNVRRSVRTVRLAQPTIAGSVARPEPEPARACFADFIPKAFVKRFERAPAGNDRATFRARMLDSHTSASAMQVACVYSAIGVRS